MGGGNTKTQPISIFALFPAVAPYRQQLYDMGLTDRDIGQLYTFFNSCRAHIEEKKNAIKYIDEVDLNLAVASLGCGNNAFIHEVLRSIISPDSESQNIPNFRDFVLIIWQFVTIGDNLSKFIFDLYDKDSCGQLSNETAQKLVKDIYGSKYEVTKGLDKLTARMQTHSTAGFPKYFFTEYACRNPLIISPCLDLRRKIFESVLGRRRWEKLTEYRLLKYRNAYKSTTQLKALIIPPEPVKVLNSAFATCSSVDSIDADSAHVPLTARSYDSRTTETTLKSRSNRSSKRVSAVSSSHQMGRMIRRLFTYTTAEQLQIESATDIRELEFQIFMVLDSVPVLF